MKKKHSKILIDNNQDVSIEQIQETRNICL
jgi:hypothetical protein